MKRKTLILFFLISTLLVVDLKGQNWKDEYDKMVISNNDLNRDILVLMKSIEHLEARISILIKDSIDLQIKMSELANIGVLQREVDRLIQDTVGRHKLEINYKNSYDAIEAYRMEIEDLEKDTVGLHRFNIYKFKKENVRDSLILKNKEVLELNVRLNNCQNRVEEYNKSRSDLKSLLHKKYNLNIAELYRLTTTHELEEDKRIINILSFSEFELGKINETIESLILVKQSEKLLGLKYDKFTIQDAIGKLKAKNIDGFNTEVINLLENYENNCDALRKVVNSIQQLNSLATGGIPDLERERKSEVLLLIEEYVYYYEVDLNRYTYLNRIISDIKTRKMQNAEADVSDLISEI